MVKWFVDVPSYDSEEPWVNVGMFDSKDDALEYAQKAYNADKQGRVCLVTEIDDGQDEEEAEGGEHVE